jgi:hypothetical protein
VKQLSEECQQFIVQAIAASMPLQELSQAVSVYFMVELSEDDLRLYDPTQNLEPSHIGPYLIRLFAATRACYELGLSHWADECAAGHGVKGHRLVLIQRTFDQIWDTRDIADLSPCKTWLVLNLLEEAAKVSNDWYEQGGDTSIGDARMMRLVALAWDVDELLKDYAGDES